MRQYRAAVAKSSRFQVRSSSLSSQTITVNCPTDPIDLTCLILGDNLIIHYDNNGNIVSSDVVNDPSGELDLALGSIEEILACVTTTCHRQCPNPSQFPITTKICSITYTDSTVTIVDNVYSVTRTFTITDACCGTATYSRTVNFTVDDETGPTITIHPTVDELLAPPYDYQPCDNDPATLPGPNPDINCECVFLGCSPTDDQIDVALGTATVDASGTLEDPVTSDVTTDGGCYFYQRRDFSAVDECGNPSEICRVVTWIVDDNPPYVDQPPPTTIPCDATVLFTAPGAADGCFDQVTYRPVDPHYIPNVDQKIQNPDGSITYIRTWTYYGACQAQTIRTQTITQLPCCNTPTIDCGGDVTLPCNDFILTDAEIADQVMGQITTCGFCETPTISIVVTGPTPIDGGFIYHVTATASVDSCDQTASCTFNATVHTCPPGPSIRCQFILTLGCGTQVPTSEQVINAAIGPLSATGFCDGPFYAAELLSSSPNGTDGGIDYRFLITVTDTCGGEVSCTITVHVPPCPPQADICNTHFWLVNPNLWDSFNDPTVAAMPSNDPAGGDLRLVTSTNLWNYFNIQPFAGLPADLTMIEAVPIVDNAPCVQLLAEAVAALLNAAAFPDYKYPQNVTTFSQLYFAIKQALVQGTNGSCTSLLVQLQNANNADQPQCPNVVGGAPTSISITCSPNLIIGCNEIPNNWFQTPTVTSDCTIDPLASADIRTPTSGFNQDGSYNVTRTWTATDNCGGVVSCSQTITVPKCPIGLRVKRTFVPSNAF